MKIEKFVPILAIISFAGLMVSLYLLSDYSTPLLNLVGDFLDSL